MTIGPVEYIIVGFPGNQFNGEIAPALADLIENEPSGSSISSSSPRTPKAMSSRSSSISTRDSRLRRPRGRHRRRYQQRGHCLRECDLEPNNSAALLVWEDVWATPFAEALRKSGGVLIEGSRIPHEIAEAVFAEFLPPSDRTRNEEFVMLRRRPIARVRWPAPPSSPALRPWLPEVSTGTSRTSTPRRSRPRTTSSKRRLQPQQFVAAPEPAPAGGMGPDQIAELKQLADLKDQGILTEEEFAAQKAKILG